MSVKDNLRASKAAWDRKEWGSCWKFANEALNEDPDSAEALYLAGCALREIGNVGMALTCYRRALGLAPGHLNLWMHFAATLHDVHQWDEARDAFLMILKRMPQDAAAMGNIASGYVQQGEPRKAVEWADKSLAIAPGGHIAHIARCFGNLGLGRWREGWEDAEWLYGHHLLLRVYNPPEREEPTWDGTKGQTVVVQMDQGIGDHIMFAQCLHELVRDCKQVIVECEHRMAGFWSRNFPEIIVYPTLGEVNLEWPARHQIDAHVHISFLGRWYRNRDEDFPRKPYLTANPEIVEMWKQHLAPFQRPWVGVAWQGGLPRTMRHLRSFQIDDLAPVMPYAGTLINMSYHDSAREVAKWNIAHPEHQVVDPHIKANDFDNTVALAAALDEVVTCTTTLAHVCGAIGRHAYVLVPQAPAWRYQYPCGDGLWWYPEGSVEMIRQVKGETNWSPAIARLARKMGAIAELRKVA